MNVVMSLDAVANYCCLSVPIYRQYRHGSSFQLICARQDKETEKESRLARQRLLITLTERTLSSLAVSTYSETEQPNKEVIPYLKARRNYCSIFKSLLQGLSPIANKAKLSYDEVGL